MRLDHLLSKETGRQNRKAVHEKCFLTLKVRGTVGLEALFNFEDAAKLWGCSSAGRAPALQAGGQEFDPPHLHQIGRIAQVVRAHA